jgi:hypothetical protein
MTDDAVPNSTSKEEGGNTHQTERTVEHPGV